MTEHLVGQLDDLAPQRAVRRVVDGVGLCIVRIGDEVHAVGDLCTHQDISLAEGEVDPDECTIECWKHGSAFSLRTGEPQSLPATRATPVYEVVVRDGEVRVVLP